MSTVYSAARPYAKAAFNVAKADGLLSEWQAFLETLALVVSDSSVTSTLNNPAFTEDHLESILRSVGSRFSSIKEKADYFIATLKSNRRFLLIPEIKHQYEEKMRALDQACLVHVTTAVPVTPEWLSKLEAVLSKKLNCRVTFECTVDESILAGALIRVGDRMIDLSVLNKLKRLLQFSLR